MDYLLPMQHPEKKSPARGGANVAERFSEEAAGFEPATRRLYQLSYASMLRL